MTPIIILPGIGGSDADHWQSLWAKANPDARIFQPACWNQPDLQNWVDALDSAVAEAPARPVLVAHSLGCLLVAHWHGQTSHVAKGAFLVAVPDPSGPAFPAAATEFVPVPPGALGFPSLVVASSDDPYASLDYARLRADQWGSDLIVAGGLGHINSQSGLGNWPAGQSLLKAFLDRLEE